MSNSLRARPRTLTALAAAAAAALVAAFAALTAPPADAQTQELPDSFTWESSGPLVQVQQTAPGRELVSIKDPTVVNVDGEWHVYATTADTGGGWSLTYFGGFTDWSQAGSVQQFHLTETAIGGGYRAAPQVFYFEPDDQWYLVYQTGLPSFSTLDHPGDPASASAAQNFMSSHPPIVDEGSSYVVDYWVTCDEVDCYLFFNNSNSAFFRAQTTVDEFPNGFGDVELFMESEDNSLFEATNVYKVGDTGEYLLIIEAIGTDGKRYFRSWTSDDLGAPGDEWEPLADTESNPFARSNNVAFPGGAWTDDISHGEMLRSGYDQTMEIDPCELQYLYQGVAPNPSGDYSQWPWELGLITQTNSSCDPDDDPTSDDPTDDDPTDPVPGDCEAAIAVVNDWGSGWQGNVSITAGDDATDGWTLSWDWPGGQSVSSMWNADWSASGSTVTASDVGWNGRIEAGQTREVFGFIASGSGAAPQIDCAAS